MVAMFSNLNTPRYFEPNLGHISINFINPVSSIKFKSKSEMKFLFPKFYHSCNASLQNHS